MSGVVAGLIGSVKAAAATPTNLVDNPSFTVNLNNWEAFGNSLRDTTNFRSSPASLNTFFDFDNDIAPYAICIQSSSLVIGQRYSISFWIRNAVVARAFRIGLGTTYTTTSEVPASGSWQYLKFENVLAASTTLTLSIFPLTNTELEFNIDDVTVVLGATALVL